MIEIMMMMKINAMIMMMKKFHLAINADDDDVDFADNIDAEEDGQLIMIKMSMTVAIKMKSVKKLIMKYHEILSLSTYQYDRKSIDGSVRTICRSWRRSILIIMVRLVNIIIVNSY